MQYKIKNKCISIILINLKQSRSLTVELYIYLKHISKYMIDEMTVQI